MRISDWSSDVCSFDLVGGAEQVNVDAARTGAIGSGRRSVGGPASDFAERWLAHHLHAMSRKDTEIFRQQLTIARDRSVRVAQVFGAKLVRPRPGRIAALALGIIGHSLLDRQRTRLTSSH